MYFLLISIMPSCSSDKFISLSETSIPCDSTPLIFDFFNFVFVPGIYVFSGANTPSIPVLTFGAPQTTWKVPLLVSTSHTFNLSASGCLVTFITFATVKGLSSSVLSSLIQPLIQYSSMWTQ